MDGLSGILFPDSTPFSPQKPTESTIGPMIDLKALRDDPARFKQGAADKQMHVDIDRILALDTRAAAI